MDNDGDRFCSSCIVGGTVLGPPTSHERPLAGDRIRVNGIVECACSNHKKGAITPSSLKNGGERMLSSIYADHGCIKEHVY